MQSIGVQGTTRFPIEVEPGRCYLAGAALIRGEARLLRIAASVGDRMVHDTAVTRPDGAVIAFCAEVEPRVTIEVDARGNIPWWAFALWPMGAAAR